jgi:hypothetical protein
VASLPHCEWRGVLTDDSTVEGLTPGSPSGAYPAPSSFPCGIRRLMVYGPSVCDSYLSAFARTLQSALTATDPSHASPHVVVVAASPPAIPPR